MSNVVSLFSKKITEPEENPAPSVNDLLGSIIDWAIANGVDIENDVSFHVRLQDFSRNIKMTLEDNKKERRTA